jgi:hypothetical protein
MDSVFPLYHVFPEFAHNFSSTGYKSYLILHFVAFRILYLRQWIFFPVSSLKWFSLKITYCQLAGADL